MVRQVVKRAVSGKHARLDRLATCLGLRATVLLVFLAAVDGCETSEKGPPVRELVQKLAEAPLGFSSAGAVYPARSETTDRLVRLGDKAVPALVEALKSESPVQVGYAAYCLREIGTARGVLEAESSLTRLRGSSAQTPETRFAIRCLEGFLSRAKENR